MLLVLVLLPTKKGLVVLSPSAGAPLLPLLSPPKVRALLLELLPPLALGALCLVSVITGAMVAELPKLKPVEPDVLLPKPVGVAVEALPNPPKPLAYDATKPKPALSSAVLLVGSPKPNDVAAVVVLSVAALGAVETEALKSNEGEALNLNEEVGATEDLLSLQNALAVVLVLVLAPKTGALRALLLPPKVGALLVLVLVLTPNAGSALV